jgi:hypothetical protein
MFVAHGRFERLFRTLGTLAHDTRRHPLLYQKHNISVAKQSGTEDESFKTQGHNIN